jgi:nitric oxide reductase subunit B
MGMVVLTLTPVGTIQMVHAAEHGFWSARSLDFYRQPLIQALLWLRIVPDLTFLLAGVVPLLVALVRAWRAMRPVTPIEPGASARPGEAPLRAPREREALTA